MRRLSKYSASAGVLGVIFLASVSGFLYASSLYDRPIDFVPQRVLVNATVDDTYPPLYEDIDFEELSLPQHDASLPFPEGGSGSYFYPANRLWGVGFNNVFQEHLLLAHLAYLTNRSFVYTPYTWNWNMSEPYALNAGNIVPSRIPWHAFMRGPAFGDAFPPGDPAPRAVRREYWETVCRWPKVIYNTPVSVAPGSRSAQDVPAILHAWVERLQSLSNRCVEVYDRAPHIFSVESFMNERITEIFESLVRSPIITHLAWSPLVLSAIQENLQALMPFAPPSTLDDKSPLQGLLVVHLRIGDFRVHCHKIYKDSIHIQGWFDLPGLPDKFDPPPESDWDGRHDYYYKSCFPSFFQIIDKVEEVRRSEQGLGLRAIYLMSNGESEYLGALKSAIKRETNWKLVMSSQDMVYTLEQLYISQAVDMAIAQRAQTFIGNGFSSLSSNVVLLRFANNMPAESNRMF